MLLLILADGHIVCLIEQNIRSHEHGIGEEADIDIVCVLLGFVLELGHSRSLAELGVAVENPRELGVGVDMALDEHDVLIRVESYREQERKSLHGLASESRGILSDGYRVALSVDIGQKCSAGDERDHVLGGFFDELKRVNILGQLAPDEQTALGTDIADRVAKLAVYHIAHEIELSAV